MIAAKDHYCPGCGRPYWVNRCTRPVPQGAPVPNIAEFLLTKQLPRK